MRQRIAATLALALMSAGCVGPTGSATAQELRAPNVVHIHPELVTSGQPTAAALRTLGEKGYQAVVYLAPTSVPDAIAEEPDILRRQGIAFIHIPIPFGQPTAEHFTAVSQALQRLSGKKTLVHCQVNMRASSMVFLHRAITDRQDAAQAYEAVAAVWSPRGPWRALLQTQLRQHGIDFEPH